MWIITVPTMVSSTLQFVILLCISISRAEATLDLFIDAEDFHKLLGVKSQLWYVNDGHIKENALGYVVPVPEEINVLRFYWQAKNSKMVPYKASYYVHNPDALNVSLSISSTGSVPTSLQPFTLVLNCTGKVTTQADVSLTLQLPLQTSLQHLTNITIHRRKVCHEVTSAMIADEESVPSMLADGAPNAVYITIGCLTAFLISVASIAAFSHNRNARRKRRRSMMSIDGTSAHNNSTAPCLPHSSMHTQNLSSSLHPLSVPSLTPSSSHPVGPYMQSAPSVNSHHSSGRTHVSKSHSSAAYRPTIVEVNNFGSNQEDSQSYCDPRQADATEKLSSVLVSEESVMVELQESLLEGTFGRLYEATYWPNKHQSVKATVKTVTGACNENQCEMLLREAVMLVGIHHSNIHQVLAAITPHTGAPPTVIYRATQHGNMKKFLQTCGPLVTREVVSMGLQVLQALSHLHQEKLLHCDVATRNCVVDANLHVMLTDCALSRDLFPSDYHCLGDNNNRPIKWLAIEALQYNSFSPQADVWAWGVLLWEVMTLGQQPYAEIDPFEMDGILRQGVRLAQPINCPDEMFQAMTFCWTTSPLERPTVSELIIFLSNFLQHLDRFV